MPCIGNFDVEGYLVWLKQTIQVRLSLSRLVFGLAWVWRCLPISQSSSSVKASSSSIPTQTGVINGNPVTYGVKTYQTVKIGTQTWMAENLNYKVSGSKCGTDDGKLSDNDTDVCATYGRLYDWETAMSVCPSGWHLPSNADWDKLVRYVDDNTGTSSPYESPTAGRYLKSENGWSEGNGEDKYGFRALPGGHGYSNGVFYDFGNSSHWWSAIEYDDDKAYSRSMGGINEYTSWFVSDKGYLFSVRCLKD